MSIIVRFLKQPCRGHHFILPLGQQENTDSTVGQEFKRFTTSSFIESFFVFSREFHWLFFEFPFEDFSNYVQGAKLELSTRSDDVFEDMHYDGHTLNGLDEGDSLLQRLNDVLDHMGGVHLELEEGLQNFFDFTRADDALREGLVAAGMIKDVININAVSKFAFAPPAMPKLVDPPHIQRGLGILADCEDAINSMKHCANHLPDFKDACEETLMAPITIEPKDAKAFCSALEHDGTYYTAWPSSLWSGSPFVDMMLRMSTRQYSALVGKKLFFLFNIAGVTHFHS